MSSKSYQKPSIKDFNEPISNNKTGASTRGVIVAALVLAAVYTVVGGAVVYLAGGVAQVAVGANKVKSR